MHERDARICELRVALLGGRPMGMRGVCGTRPHGGKQ